MRIYRFNSIIENTPKFDSSIEKEMLKNQGYLKGIRLYAWLVFQLRRSALLVCVWVRT